MNANNNDDIVISRRAIVNFVYIVIYAIITTIVNKWINEYLKKKVGVETVEEQEERRRILPEEEVASLEEVVANEEEDDEVVVVNLEKDATMWYPIEDKKGRYKGEWRNGLPNGIGIKHIYKDDTYIYGNFIDGNAEGHCKQTFEQTWERTQPYYEGNFKRNEYHGKGEYHYGDGGYYKGEWKDSKYNGYGTEYSKSRNKTWVGYFENDEKVEGNWVRGEI
jgi:hypothetical protein